MILKLGFDDEDKATGLRKGKVIFMAGRRQHLTPLGKEIKKRLIDKSMSQVELAEIVGTSKYYISKIISGTRTGNKYVQKICSVLDIDYEKYKSVA